jgi:DNA gyrase/topoisomerase IV subunit A
MNDGSQPGLFDPSSSSEDSLTLGLYAEQAYLDYAVSVVRGRALPDVGDGQKPVQRRILYAMQAMGLQSGAKPVKSARVVGDVLGKYHPHGDQAAYDALVRMAQRFSLRYPLIDGQGNFGSRDGDNAAAMRYTEARLTPFARLLLEELDEGTVDFIPNYDGSHQEPQMLPARLPVMLLNGASGIAVGMATEIPAHNLREIAQACVALLKQPALSDEALFEMVPGPDFAGGGQIITPVAEIAQIYQSGRGSIKARARWRMLVYLNVDEVIQTIRESDEPRSALMKRFKLTERQADDILDMRLRQLARLEGIKIEQELSEKRAEQEKLKELIDQPTALKRLIIKEIEADAKQYGDDRRTLIKVAERAVMEVRLLDEPITVIVSQKGWLRARQGHGHDPSQFNFKAGDDCYGVFECRSTDTLVALGSSSRKWRVVSGSWLCMNCRRARHANVSLKKSKISLILKLRLAKRA